MLWASPELAFGSEECSDVAEIGPLSLLPSGDEAALVRLCHAFPATDVEIVRLRCARSRPAANGADPIEEGLRRHADAVAAAPLGVLDRAFYEWYWPQLSPAQSD
jgi:hypothetical protein